MTSVRLHTYDPSSSAKWDALDDAGKALWRRAIEEIHEFGAARKETKDAWRATIHERRKVRKRSYATTADVARRLFNVLAGRAWLSGHKLDRDALPDPEEFSSLREIREFFAGEMQKIKETRARRVKPCHAHAMPTTAPGEGPFFPARTQGGLAASFGLPARDDSIVVHRPGENDEALLTQAFYFPDIDTGFAVIVTTQKIGDERFVCLSGKSSPTRFRSLLPQLATLLAERLFPNEDRAGMHFFVYHPLGYGERHNEQYWKYDLRPDARGQFRMAARQQMQVVPHAIANRTFADGRPESETSLIEVDAFWPWRAGVKAEIMRQESYSRRREGVLARRAARQRPTATLKTGLH